MPEGFPDPALRPADAFVHGVVRGGGGCADGDHRQGTDKSQKRQADAVCDFVHDLNERTIIVE